MKTRIFALDFGKTVFFWNSVTNSCGYKNKTKMQWYPMVKDFESKNQKFESLHLI